MDNGANVTSGHVATTKGYQTSINQENAHVVVVVVLTLTRIIKSVVTGQAPVTLELRNTPARGKTQTKPKVVHA